MGQQPWLQLNMNPTTPARSSGYHQKAMEEIHNSLLPFAKSSNEVMGSSAASTISTLSTTSGVSSLSSASGSNGTDKDIQQLRQMLAQLLNMGYTEVSRNNQYNNIFGLLLDFVFILGVVCKSSSILRFSIRRSY